MAAMFAAKVKKSVRRLGDEAGATMVEFAIVVVLLFTIVTLIVQGGLFFSAWLAITNGAREGARYGATCLERSVESCDDTMVATRALSATVGFLDPTSVVVLPPVHDSSVVTVTVTCVVDSVSPFIPPLPLRAESVMRLENGVASEE